MNTMTFFAFLTMLFPLVRSEEYSYLLRKLKGKMGLISIHLPNNEKKSKLNHIEEYMRLASTFADDGDAENPDELELTLTGKGESLKEGGWENLTGELGREIQLEYLHPSASNIRMILPKNTKVSLKLNICLGKFMKPWTYASYLKFYRFFISLDNGVRISFSLEDLDVVESNYDARTKNNVLPLSDESRSRLIMFLRRLKEKIRNLFDTEIKKIESEEVSLDGVSIKDEIKKITQESVL